MNLLNPAFLPGWAQTVFFLAVTFAAGLGAAWLLTRVAIWWGHKHSKRLDNVVISNMRLPLSLMLPFGFMFLASWFLQPQLFENPVFTGSSKIFFVFMLAWLLVGAIRTFAAFLNRHFDVTVSDNLRARGIHTQINVGRRIAVFVVVVLAIGSLFLLFEDLRGIGVSVIASAGVAGIIIGFAAQKALGNLLAGIQIALTQPIRLEDVVIVEGEWGWIEEITLTYVVVRVWDLRRLVVPISYFIEKPFQNWTRRSADILGTVFLYTDYTMPIDAIREHVTKFLEGNERWDEKVNVVQVTECKPDVMEVRVLVSARNSSEAWNLRCEVRESLISFVQANYPDALPKTRASLESERDLPEMISQKKTQEAA